MQEEMWQEEQQQQQQEQRLWLRKKISGAEESSSSSAPVQKYVRVKKANKIYIDPINTGNAILVLDDSCCSGSESDLRHQQKFRLTRPCESSADYFPVKKYYVKDC